MINSIIEISDSTLDTVSASTDNGSIKFSSQGRAILVDKKLYRKLRFFIIRVSVAKALHLLMDISFSRHKTDDCAIQYNGYYHELVFYFGGTIDSRLSGRNIGLMIKYVLHETRRR